jgi:hypothetical protein
MQIIQFCAPVPQQVERLLRGTLLSDMCRLRRPRAAQQRRYSRAEQSRPVCPERAPAPPEPGLKPHHDRPAVDVVLTLSPTTGSQPCCGVLSVSSGTGGHRAVGLGSAHGPASRRGGADVQACGAIAASPPRRTRPLPLRSLSAKQGSQPRRHYGQGLDADGLRALLRPSDPRASRKGEKCHGVKRAPRAGEAAADGEE